MAVVVHHGHVEKMKTLKPSKQIYNEAITKGRQHSLYIVVYTEQKDSSFAVPAGGASTGATSARVSEPPE